MYQLYHNRITVIKLLMTIVIITMISIIKETIPIITTIIIIK